MKKWLIALSSLLIILIAIVSGLYFPPVITNILNPHPLPLSLNGLSLRVSNGNYMDSEGLTVREKMNAIAFALNDSVVKESIQNYASTAQNISIGNVTLIGDDDSGFLNAPSKIVYVTIAFEGGLVPFYNYYIVYVDLSDNKTLGQVTYSDKIGPTANVVIPPGSAWYHQIITGIVAIPGEGNILQMSPTVTIDIDDVNITSPLILSTDNFEKFKNGSPYKPLEYIDYVTNVSCIAGGNQSQNIIAIDKGTAIWRANVTLGHAPIDLDYYMVVVNKNKDKEINIGYWT